MERIVSVLALLWAGAFAAGPDFCYKGFQVATRYHDCWQQSKFTNKYPDLYERHEFLDADFLERYASHMCSVVKPDALACFKKDVKDCPNKVKLIGIADESGGACKGNELNPFFKEHVINHLVTVTGDRESPCFTIGDASYDQCYIAAGREVLESGKSDEISRFHYVADMFFETYWDCLIKDYKSQAKLCPNWQIPMLLVLQKTALPSLFGMRLRPEQVSKLELEPSTPLGLKRNQTSVTSSGKGGADCEDVQDKKVYLLMQVLSQKPSLTSSGGNLVVELSNLNSDTPKISLQGSQGMDDKEVMNFVQILSGPNTEYSLKERRRRRKEERKKNKHLKNISNKLKGEEEESKKTKKNRKSKSKSKPKPKTKKSQKKQKQQDKPVSIYDKMV